MPISSDKRLPILNTPKGINNVDDPSSPAFQPPSRPQTPMPFLRRAENVDIDRNGNITRRKGYTKVVPLTDGRRLASFSSRLLCVDGSTLYDVSPQYNLTPIATGLDPNLPVICTEYGGSIWWACGSIRGSIREDPWIWGLPTPSILSVEKTSGQLLPGRYMVTLTIEKDGLESGAPAPQVVELEDQGGIIIHTTTLDADVVNLYCTDPNGELLYYASNSLNPSTHTIEEVSTTDPLEFLSCYPPPTGQLLVGFGGRLLIASDNVLYWSLPGAYHHWRVGLDLQLFPHRITMLAPMDKGFFVGTEHEVYWIQGDDPENWSPRLVDSKPALEGRTLYLEGRKIPELNTTEMVQLWSSIDGLAIGLPGGTVLHPTDGVVSTDSYKYATIEYREDRSLRQILLGLREKVSTTTFGASDTATCRIVRAKST